MSEVHIPLALKYRPKTFEDLIGQEAAATILRNMIKSRQIYPGLIFCGNRGSGKTTSARVYAKALNCEAPVAGDPCCECRTCKDIQRDACTGVLEKDAASHNSVNDVRKIIDICSYACQTPYRVIIYDEAHMLTPQAWNAMLKTLEEPPPNTIFIFVTTEVGKVPETIQSRCFMVPYRAIDIQAIAERVWDVSQTEHIPITSEVAVLISQRANGAMRDALVMLEQVSQLNENKETEITMNHPSLMQLGYCGEAVYESIIQAWQSSNVDKFLSVVRHWVRLTGPDNFAKGWEDAFYGWLMRKVGAEPQRQATYISSMSLETIQKGINLLWQAKRQGQGDPKRFEVALIINFFPAAVGTDTNGATLRPPNPQALPSHSDMPALSAPAKAGREPVLASTAPDLVAVGGFEG